MAVVSSTSSFTGAMASIPFPLPFSSTNHPIFLGHQPSSGTMISGPSLYSLFQHPLQSSSVSLNCSSASLSSCSFLDIYRSSFLKTELFSGNSDQRRGRLGIQRHADFSPRRSFSEVVSGEVVKLTTREAMDDGWKVAFRDSQPVTESIPWNESECENLLAKLINETRALGTSAGINIIAFSGGVDSSLVAYLVHKAFNGCGATFACIGKSAALPVVQLETARIVASSIGIRLLEVETTEGEVEEYIANEGQSCFYCKSTLYSTLQSLAKKALEHTNVSSDVVLFNGTNADDLRDPSRLGLLAAFNFQVASPLATLPKAAVRAVARHVGLPNWDLAAAPCLRSRLDYGVSATAETLAMVGIAEEKVREILSVSPTENMRVRILAERMAVLEIQEEKVMDAKRQEEVLKLVFRNLQLKLELIRPFRSGSLSLKMNDSSEATSTK